ncbi:MAG: guanylate kinase [Lachnospiraceae bacterium]|nr:guanylate kinase [Lachnospiraceae bacterium]
MKRGLLIIVSGFSGAGKGTIVRGVISRYDNYALSVSATTRRPRNGEIDGKDYFFISRDEFESKISNDELIEYASYVGNYYGTPKDYVDSMLDSGKDVILEIEMQGAMKVKARMPEAILVFVSAPDAGTLQRRLAGRGTENPEQVSKRLMRAVEETEYMKDYDYILVNDDLEKSIDCLNSIVHSEHCRSKHNSDFIECIRKDLKDNFGR